MKFLSILIVAAYFLSAFAERRFDSSILNSFEEKQKVNVIVSFKGNNATRIVDSLKTSQLTSRSEKARLVYHALKSHADVTQQSFHNFVSKHKSAATFEVFQLWITNQAIIKNMDKNLFEELLTLHEVSKITEEQSFKLPKILTKEPRIAPNADGQWGVVAIEAPEVWKAGFKGQGVVIANIDSGVRGSHEALKDGFRQLYGWYDPVYKTSEPVDTVGHGTHTMGTILGRSNGIGVAPEAQWISCRACPDEDCTTTDLHLCGQWVVCPSDTEGNNVRCDIAPDIVSNSWGFGRNQFFHDVIHVWIAAGIIPVVSSGNFGASCGSILSPSDHPEAIAVGSIDSQNTVSSFSGRGPVTATGIMKPEIAAPGLEIYSAYSDSDDTYVQMDGTSMAAPHVSGMIALLLSRKPDLIQSQVELLLSTGAMGITSSNETCAGVKDDKYPNNQVGYGKINAKRSFDTLGLIWP